MRLIGIAFAVTLSLTLAPLAAGAESTQRVYKIGFLGQMSPSDSSSQIKALRQGLRDAGYQDGANLFIEYRWAEGRLGRLPSLATDLVRFKVDLIVADGTAGAQAAKQATATIPIIFVTAGDAGRGGMVTSLSRPGGNMTGLSIQETDVAMKQLDLLKQVAPTVSRIVLLRVASSGPEDVDESLEQEQNAARSLGLELKKFVVEPKDPTHAFLHLAQHGAHAIVVENTPALRAHAAAIAALAVEHRLPTIGAPWFAGAGLLLGYGPSVEDATGGRSTSPMRGESVAKAIAELDPVHQDDVVHQELTLNSPIIDDMPRCESQNADAHQYKEGGSEHPQRVCLGTYRFGKGAFVIIRRASRT